MGIKSPETYSDWYWKNSVEATAEFDENIEAALSPLFKAIFDDIPEIVELPKGIQGFLQALTAPETAGFGGFITAAGGEFAAEIVKDAISPAMSMMKRYVNTRALETWLTTLQADTLFARGKIDESYWSLISKSEGYEPVIGKQRYESQLPYPTIPDLVLYERYHGDPTSTKSGVWDYFDVSGREFKIWEWLQLQRLTTLQVQALYKRGLIDDSSLNRHLLEIGWDGNSGSLIKDLSYAIPNAMLLVQGDLMQGKGRDDLIKDISIADIHPKYANEYLDAVLTKPSSQDIIAYELRRNPELTNLDKELRRIGIHDSYFPLYKELAQQIPPIADIITMAVREAFTPAIAGKFGQYQDFPQQLEEWAMKKGLSAEWAKRYWAAHWSLPSPLQGFEMLHRGAINESELNMLLRALDIMPFWRGKLTQIAYRRLTRVDIRRMYGLGVLTEKDVYDAYVELGYNDRDARRMSDFTVKQILASQSKFTARDIVSAYSKYMINRSEASSLLRNIGVRSENISFIMSSADYKREWNLTESKISAIRNLYKKRVYDENQARGKLSGLNMPSKRVDALMEQWYIDIADIPVRYWTTSQTLSFMKDKIITIDRGRQELVKLGYDEEHINVYLKASE